MKKILMIFMVGIVAMSALSCTSKLENEIAELKKQINVKPEPEPKFELVIENPNILPCATLEGEQTHKFKVPYTLKNATGKTTVTAICKSYFGDNIRVGTVPADEKSGFVNIQVEPYKDYFDEGDGYYYSYSGASIYVTALDESGKTSVQIIRIPLEGFTIGLVDSYDGNPSITVPATADKASFCIDWRVAGAEKYFPSLGSFKVDYPFERPYNASSADNNSVLLISFETHKGTWSNISYTSESSQDNGDYKTVNLENLEVEKFLDWTMFSLINLKFDKNTTGSERVFSVNIHKKREERYRPEMTRVFIIQKP